MNNKLLNGKAEISKVVGLECVDDTAEVFIQDENGSVHSRLIPHRYWILSNTPLTPKAAKLEGDLHFKYGYQFDTREHFEKARMTMRQYDTYSIYNAEEACMVKDGIVFYKDMKLSDLSLLSFDIETTGLDGNADDAKVLIITTTFRNHLGISVNRMFCHDEYQTEGELLTAFCDYVRQCDPSVILGHNIITYDFPYLQARADANNVHLFMGRNMSPIKFNAYESKFRLDGTRDLMYKNVSIYGREICDTYFLSVSFDVSKSFETYALKPLIKQLGFEKPGRQYYDAQNIRTAYQNPTEWEKIKAYAEADAEDPIKLFDMMAPLYFNMCPIIPKPFSEMLLSASGSKINALLVRAYLQDKHSIPKATPTESFQGALSFAVPGLYANCFKIDIASLYPNIIINYSVYDNEKDPKCYLLELVKTFKDNRLKLKKLASETGDPLYKQMDTTTKGILNSFYGFFSAAGLNFNSPECGSFITARGREILEYTIKWASGKDASEFIKTEEEDEEGECA